MKETAINWINSNEDMYKVYAGLTGSCIMDKNWIAILVVAFGADYDLLYDIIQMYEFNDDIEQIEDIICEEIYDPSQGYWGGSFTRYGYNDIDFTFLDQDYIDKKLGVEHD